MKVLFITPHLSTGGMPAFLLKRIQALQQYTDFEIYVVEWKFLSPHFIVQRDKIQKLVGENFISCFGDEEIQNNIVDYCYEKEIDIIHIEEIPEGFGGGNNFHPDLQKELYKKSHPWKIVESAHGMWFNPNENKIHEPDGYALVTNHHIKETFKNRPALKSLIPFPIDTSIQSTQTRDEILNEMGYLLKGEFHIINVGLWTPGKNQGYAIEIARALYEKYGFTYIFHFIGNQAGNFADYWTPLIENLPPNVRIWGERKDTEKFFKMADLMLFTSTWECNPIVLKEAISNNIKIMANNLDHYGKEYIPFINNLTGNVFEDKNKLIEIIHSPIKYTKHDIKNNVQKFAENHVNFYNSLLNGK
jgi:glycosyltransferase involved in cell wall biosynthesis